jgi:hypothetical protein
MSALVRLLLTFVAVLTIGVPSTSAAHRHAQALPPGIREIDVDSSRAISRHVTDPARVAKIVAWFDALPIAPSTHYYCPFIRYRPPTTFDFRAGGGAVLAHAFTPGTAACGGSIDFTIRDRPQRPLLLDHFLVRVGHMLRMRVEPVYR